MRLAACITLVVTSAFAQAPVPPLPTGQLPPPPGRTATGPTATDPATTPTPTATPSPLAPVRLSRNGQTVLSPRIRNVTRLANSMPHLLTGVGLVTGLDGNGASDRGTRQAILNFIQRHGLNLTIADVQGGSTALVSLTCSLPPFAKQGQELDVKAQVLSDATSLRGGQLIRAELKGVDGSSYVVAQGGLIVAGVSAKGNNANVQKNIATTAWLHNGGIVIRTRSRRSSVSPARWSCRC